MSLHLHTKKLILLSLSAASICAYFWMSSRYPALNLKALMNGQSAFAGIGFDVLVAVSDQQTLAMQILNTTLNWLYSNMVGMSFGLLIAPVILSAFTLLAQYQPKNSVAASLVGVIIGSPLGVCANCATPIALGIAAGKGRVETLLGVIVSSPTLNIVAITMMISILPFYIVAIKLLLTLSLILIGIPLLSKFTATQNEIDIPSKLIKPSYNVANENLASDNSWQHSIVWLLSSYTRHFWFIIKVALPFMILAGLLGATLITLMPAELLQNLKIDGYFAKTTVLSLVSVVAALLPVPMTFDIILASNLHLLGVEARYVSAVLFGLGSFSIYPYLVLRQHIGKQLANGMMLTVVVLSFIAGLAAHYLAPAYEQWQEQQFTSKLLQNSQALSVISYQNQPTPAQPKPVSATIKPSLFFENSKVVVYQQAFEVLATEPHQAKFKRHLGDIIGLTSNYKISLELFTDIGLFKGIASGDINADGWDDILVNDSSGLRLFINQQQLHFSELPLPGYNRSKNLTTAVTLADMNNDGQLDIIYAVAYEGLFYLENSQGQFSKPAQALPNLATATISPDLAVADVDKDGDLDILVSNWTTGSFGDSFNLNDASNAVLLNNKGIFTVKKLGCAPGETLSILATDFNQDRWPDLMIANDFLPDDCFYQGSKTGLSNSSNEAIGININPIHSMSYDSGDINNDGLLDYFATDITDPYNDIVAPLDAANTCKIFDGSEHFSTCVESKRLRMAVNQKHDYINCIPLTGKPYFAECQAYIYFLQTMSKKTDCATIPKQWSLLGSICNDAKQAHKSALGLLPNLDFNGHRGNTLHRQNTDGTFTNIEKEAAVRHTGWSWNARFADLNHDTWQDLFIVNGYPLQAYDETNLLLLNDGKEGFYDITAEAELEDWNISSNYSYADFDNDGDLDIVTHSPYGPMQLWQNQLAKGNAIKVSLIDRQGNYFGVGAKIKIHYGDKKIQIREMKLSGGFGSKDAPYLHFGLADESVIDALEVIWLSGEISVINQPIPTNKHYIIERSSH